MFSLDAVPVRYLVLFSAVVTGCVHLPGGYMPVSGYFFKVSSDDVRSAVQAYASSPRHYRTYRVQVIGPDEIHIYSLPDVEGYFVIRRVNGKWIFDGEVIVTE